MSARRERTASAAMHSRMRCSQAAMPAWRASSVAAEQPGGLRVEFGVKLAEGSELVAELAAESGQVAELAEVLRPGRGRCEVVQAAEAGEHGGIDTVILRQSPEGFGEASRAQRIDQDGLDAGDYDGAGFVNSYVPVLLQFGFAPTLPLMSRRNGCGGPTKIFKLLNGPPLRGSDSPARRCRRDLLPAAAMDCATCGTEERGSEVLEASSFSGGTGPESFTANGDSDHEH